MGTSDNKQSKLDSLNKTSKSLNENAQKINATVQNITSAIDSLKSANQSLGNPIGKGVDFISQKVGLKEENSPVKDSEPTTNEYVTENSPKEESTAKNIESPTSSEVVKTQSGTSNFKKGLAIFFMVLAVVYTVSPIDLSPDAIPIVGWFDDVGVLLTGGVNLIQQYVKNQESFMVKILKYIKWFMVIGVVIAALLLGGLITAIVALVTK